MKKWIIPLLSFCIFCLAGCSSTQYTPNHGSLGMSDFPVYPGGTGIAIENADRTLPDIIFSTSGSENGLTDTMYLIEGEVTDCGVDNGCPYFTVTTKKGIVWISDISTNTALSTDNTQSQFDLDVLQTYYPIPEPGELVRVYAQYQGMNVTANYPCFIYGGTDYLAKALKRSSYNPLIAADLQEIPVWNGSKTEIKGFYACIEISKATLKQITLEEYREFCTEIVNNSPYNWVSIKCDDGTGIQFPGSQYAIASYGKLDNECIISTVIGDICQTENGFEYKLCN